MTDTGVAYWDAQAATVEDARRAVWAADGWDEGVADTLDILGRWLVDLPDRPRLVDVGCGMGRVAVPAVSRFKAHVVGVDPSRAMIARASETTGTGNPTWVGNDGLTLPEWIGLFDGGWSVLCFQHLPDEVVAGYLADLPRVLRPDARFVAQFSVGEGRGPHCYERSVDEIASLVERSRLRLLALAVGEMQPNWAWAVMT